eukprot:3376344-Pleurochrysis_carterae.AAC.1
MPFEPAAPSRSTAAPLVPELPPALAVMGKATAAAADVRAAASAAATCSARALGACLDRGGVASTSERYAVAVANLRNADGPNGSAAGTT